MKQLGSVAAWTMELPSGEIYFDPIKASQLGYDPTEDRFKTYHGFTKLIHPDDYENTMQTMRDHLEGRTPMYRVEYRIAASDGKWHTYVDQGIVQEREGDIIRLFGATMDVTK